MRISLLLAALMTLCMGAADTRYLKPTVSNRFMWVVHGSGIPGGAFVERIADGYNTAGIRLGGNNHYWRTDNPGNAWGLGISGDGRLQLEEWAQHDVAFCDLHSFADADSYALIVQQLLAHNSNMLVGGFFDPGLYWRWHRYQQDSETPGSNYNNRMIKSLRDIQMEFPWRRVLGDAEGDTAEGEGYGAGTNNALLIVNVIDPGFRAKYTDTIAWYLNGGAENASNLSNTRFIFYQDVLEDNTGSTVTDYDQDGLYTYIDSNEREVLSRARQDIVQLIRSKVNRPIVYGGQTWHAARRTARSDSMLAVLNFIMLEDFHNRNSNFGARNMYNFFDPASDYHYKNILDGMMQTPIKPFILIEHDYDIVEWDAVCQLDPQLYPLWNPLNRSHGNVRNYVYPADIGYAEYDLGDTVSATIDRGGNGLRLYREYTNGSVLVHLKSDVTTSSPYHTPRCIFWIATGAGTLNVSNPDTAWTDTMKGTTLVRSNAWPNYRKYYATTDTTTQRSGHVYGVAGANSIRTADMAWTDHGSIGGKWPVGNRRAMHSMMNAQTANQGTKSTSSSGSYVHRFNTAYPPASESNTYQTIMYFSFDGIPRGTHVKRARLWLSTGNSAPYSLLLDAATDTLYASLLHRVTSATHNDTAWVNFLCGATCSDRANEGATTWLEPQDGNASLFWFSHSMTDSSSVGMTTHRPITRRGLKSWYANADTTMAGANDWIPIDVTAAVQAIVNGTYNGGWLLSYRRSGAARYWAVTNMNSGGTARNPFVTVEVGYQ